MSISSTEKTVTLRDIAARCHVSVATVSRALRNPSTQREETVKLIEETALAMGYDPANHYLARRMSLRKYGKEMVNNLIALVLPPKFYASIYFAEIFQGVLDVLTPAGYGLLTIDTSISSESPLPPCFSRGDVDGVLVCSPPESFQPVYESLRQHVSFGARPIVFLNETMESCSAVSADKQDGAYLAARHLLQLGHRHMAYIRGLDDFHHEIRPNLPFFEGFQQACREQGLDPEEHLIPAEIGHRLWEIALIPKYQAKMWFPDILPLSANNRLLKLLRQRPEITAILTQSDNIAFIIYHLLTRNGYRVPQDISLVGSDDTIPIYGNDGHLILTTIKVPLRQLGRSAAQFILDRITGKETQDKQILLPTKLIIRSSTAAPKSVG